MSPPNYQYASPNSQYTFTSVYSLLMCISREKQRLFEVQNPENHDIFREKLVSKRRAYISEMRSSGGRVVKLLACGARGPGFDSRPRHLDFQRLVISCFQVKIWLKDR